MDEKQLKSFLKKIATGKMTHEEGFKKIKHLFVGELGYAHVDHHRAIRCGFPEVIFCPGKSAEQIEGIAKEILKRHSQC